MVGYSVLRGLVFGHSLADLQPKPLGMGFALHGETMKNFSFLIVLCLSSCGFIPSEDFVTLKLKLPQSIPKTSARFQRFWRQAAFLEVLLEPGEKDHKTFTYPLGNWEEVRIPSGQVSRQSKESLTIWVRIWERAAITSVQKTPLAQGRVTLAPGMKLAELPLTLSKSPEAFDSLGGSE